jgi:type II secretory pathway pseudopilin PulG
MGNEAVQPLRGIGAPPKAGFSLVELTIVVSVLLFALLAMSRSLGESMQLNEVNRENGLANDAAREMVEVLDGVENFDQVFFLYNADPEDDPGMPGSAPGAGFAVQGLDPVEGDPDGLVGEIFFPTATDPAGRLELHENVDDPGLGMPRDLDGDGDADATDVSATYRLLPVRVRLRWQGASGERALEVRTLIADR